MLSTLEIKLIAEEVSRNMAIDVDSLAYRLAQEIKKPTTLFISQNEAMRIYGRAKVNRWRENGQVKRYLKQNGKLNGYEYKVADLDKLSELQHLVKLK
jgi:hypothetical protein